jgi:hypothetical protein
MVRERRAETSIDALAILGRLAAYVSEPDRRADPFDAIPGDHWRRFQAQVEAFASTQVVALRDPLLVAWERFRVARAAVGAAGGPEAAAGHGKEADGHSADARVLNADLISQVREELKQDNEPWWRRRRPARGRRVGAREGGSATGGRSASAPEDQAEATASG